MKEFLRRLKARKHMIWLGCGAQSTTGWREQNRKMERAVQLGDQSQQAHTVDSLKIHTSVTSPTCANYPIKCPQQHPVKDALGSNNSKYLKFPYPSSKSGEVLLDEWNTLFNYSQVQFGRQVARIGAGNSQFNPELHGFYPVTTVTIVVAQSRK
ncbi:hypothetical protein L3X38_033107 [Prunus dulcis]|uniref:Uncharacterized protein n=1 Tax=Prunus dulcis TaxID=3755 RepID=A0AAD4VGQ3_PRUDU|nr:hypothetical protein L3X38_033107 [Prunus dulcis]